MFEKNFIFFEKKMKISLVVEKKGLLLQRNSHKAVVEH